MSRKKPWYADSLAAFTIVCEGVADNVPSGKIAAQLNDAGFETVTSAKVASLIYQLGGREDLAKRLKSELVERIYKLYTEGPSNPRRKTQKSE